MNFRRRLEISALCVFLVLLICAPARAQTQIPHQLARGPNWAAVPLLAPGSNLCIVSPGQAVDPQGDALASAPNAPGPDMVSGSATVIGDSVRLRVRFVPGTFDPSTTIANFLLDTDQNVGTGSASLSADGRTQDGSLGADYLVSMGSTTYGKQAQVSKFAGAAVVGNWAYVGSSPVTIYADGYDALIPLSLIKTLGSVNFKVTSQTVLAYGSVSPILDIMPDLGTPAAATNCVSPAFLPPLAFSGGVLNASSFTESAVSPGEIVTLFGIGLGPKIAAGLQLTEAGLVSTELANTQVFFDGIAAPLIYAQDGQMSAVVPYGVAGRSITQMHVENNGQRSTTVPLRVATSAPGLFTIDASGIGQGAILNEDASVNSGSNAADRGSIVVLYGTGEGQTLPSVADGRVSGIPLAKPILPVSVTIGGIEAEVLYAGAAPGLVAGVLQVNVRVPASLSPAADVPVILQVGDKQSAAGVTLAIK